MLHQKQKIVHLLDELLHYVLETEPRQVHITIEDLADEVKITIEDRGTHRSAQELERAQRLLNAPHRSELTDYYGGLAGEDDCGPCNLRLAAMMVDGARIEPGPEGTRLIVWWQQE